jgi:hypothetical protein
MITATKNYITISIETWEALKNDEYFGQLIEEIEDREDFIKAKKDTEYFVNFSEYDKKRREQINA